MPFIPHTDKDIQVMLDTIGVKSIEDLFDEIPEHLKSGKLQKVPEGVTEMQVMRTMRERAGKDAGVLNFIGAGAYEHHVPSAVWQLVTRGEFYTAYTPYQAEASQGTLQMIYEYQSMMTQMMAMDVSNATVYDGGSGLAEAVLMAIRANRKSKSHRVLVPENLNPAWRSATNAIVSNQSVQLETVPYDSKTGATDFSALEKYAKEDFAALVIAQPNFFGTLEDVHGLTDWAQANGMLVIAAVNPTAMAVLAPPGEWGSNGGADIAVGDGQPLGIPLSSGGPYYGFMCCKQGIVRQMPGRIIGRTVDLEGKDGFALTLQAREQHIRRSKATSNICTNQGLAMAASTVYMSLMGGEGLRRVATHCHNNTGKWLDAVCSVDGVAKVFDGPSFHEAVIQTGFSAADVLAEMEKDNISGGLALGAAYQGLENAFVACLTETKTDQDIESYVQSLGRALSSLKGGA